MMYIRSQLPEREAYRQDVSTPEPGPEVHAENLLARRELHARMLRRGTRLATPATYPTEFYRWAAHGVMQSPARGRVEVQASKPFSRWTAYSALRAGMPPHELQVGKDGNIQTVGHMAAYAEVDIQQATGPRSRHSALLLRYFFQTDGHTTITGLASPQDAAEFELVSGLWQATGLQEVTPLPAPSDELTVFFAHHAVGPVAIRGLADYLIAQPPLPGAAAPQHT